MAIPTPEPRIARFERMGYGMFIHCVQNLARTRLFPSLSIAADSED